MNGGWIFLIILILAILLGGGGYIAYRKFYLKQDVNLSYPAPAPSNLLDRAKDLWSRVRNPKTQSGAGYESASRYGPPGSTGGGRRGHALDPDEAWDSRVGNEADVYGPGGGGYYEEQELGYRGASSGGGGFRQTETLGAPSAAGDAGRSRSPAGKTNPFGDDAAASSLRSVSPRPHLDTRVSRGASRDGRGSAESSPTFERRSIFREEV